MLKWFHCIVIITLIMIPLMSCFPLSGKHNKLLKPTEDLFYEIPAELEKFEPGTILKSREMPHGSFSFFPTFPRFVKNAYQLLYRTTDSLGKPTVSVTTVIVPPNADPKKLVSYQVIQDNISLDCVFSYMLQKPMNKNDLVPQAEIFLMNILLENGWYVSAIDYEGIDSMFGAGRLSGQAVLDGARAVLASRNITGFDPTGAVQLWGYSGGALASGWAAQLAPSYAPELNIIGTVIGGTPVDLNATVAAVDGTKYSGVAISGILGIAQQYKEFGDHMDSILLPEKKEAFYNVGSLCYGEIMRDYAFQDLKSYFTRPDWADSPILKPIIEENQMGRIETPPMPIYAYHALHDRVSPYQLAANVFAKWCNQGADIEFVTETDEDHGGLLFSGAPGAVLFMAKRFDGVPLSSPGCSSRSTNNGYLDPPGALTVVKQGWLAAFKALFGFHRKHGW